MPSAGSRACGLSSELQVGSAHGRAPGAMASRGRKRKAEVAVVAVAAKQEKPAGGRKAVEEATVVIEHW